MENMEAVEPLIRIERERCIGCFECVDICPQVSGVEFPVFERGAEGFPIVACEESCIGCLSCEAACRADAIRVEVEAGSERYGPVAARAEIKCGAMF